MTKRGIVPLKSLLVPELRDIAPSKTKSPDEPVPAGGQSNTCPAGLAVFFRHHAPITFDLCFLLVL